MPESGLFVPIVGASQTKRRADDRHFQNGKPGKVHPSQPGFLEDDLSFFKFKFGGWNTWGLWMSCKKIGDIHCNIPLNTAHQEIRKRKEKKTTLTLILFW